MFRAPSRPLFGLALVLSLSIAFAVPSDARRLSFIRDAEIEHIIRSYTTPLFAVAGIDAAAVRVHLVADSRINAFVAGGQNIFVFTGLILKADNPEQIIGVLAHETGHIAGGHLARTQDALRNASAKSILAAVIGVAAIIGGQGRAGAAIFTTGQAAAQQSLLHYTRTQEAAADQAAFRYLEQTGQSARGLLEVLEKLGDQEALLSSRQDPYARSHPLSRERIALLRNRVTTSRYAKTPSRPDFAAALARSKAKISAFLGKPAATFRRYPESDDSTAAHYARAIAHHRVANLSKALAEIEVLLEREPDDPYFHELKGQIYFENGRVADALPPLERAVALASHEPLLRIGLARAQIALENPALHQAAIMHLTEALDREPTNAGGWHQLAIAYGRDGQFGHSALANAEWSLLIGRKAQARQQAERAERDLPSGSPGWLRAQDIQRLAHKR